MSEEREKKFEKIKIKKCNDLTSRVRVRSLHRLINFLHSFWPAINVFYRTRLLQFTVAAAAAGGVCFFLLRSFGVLFFGAKYD